MTKTSVAVLSLITGLTVLPLMVALSGCLAGRQTQTTGQTIEDSRTAERVREALAAAPGYKFDGVRVAACKGIVQLRGFVNTRDQMDGAADIASKVPGAQGVENNLTLKD